MVNLNERIAVLFREAEWNSPMWHFQATDFLDIGNFYYRRVSYINRQSTDITGPWNRPIRLFDLERSRRFDDICRSQKNLQEVEQLYVQHVLKKRRMPDDLFHLLGSFKTEISRKFPLDWGKFQFLQPMRINKLAHKETYEEVRSENDGNSELTSDNSYEEIVKYNKRLKVNLKMSLLFRHFQMESRQNGFYKPPRDWGEESFFNDMCRNQVPLRDFGLNLADQTNQLFEKTLSELSSSANTFFNNMNLDNSGFWRDKGREYASHLRHYNQIKNCISDVVYNAYDTLFNAYRQLLADHLDLLDTIINR